MTGKPDDPEATPDEPENMPESEGDLNFATESSVRRMFENKPSADQGDSARAADADGAGRPAENDDGHAEEASKSSASKSDDAREIPAGKADSLADTWVPESQDVPQQQSSSGDPDHQENDADKTWVPTDTPTFDGLQDAAPAESSADAADAAASSGADTDDDDPNKTWVPAGTPTVHGLEPGSSGADAQEDGESSEEDDPSRTWVPSQTPTVSGQPGAMAEQDVANESPVSGDGADEDTFEKTWTMEAPEDRSTESSPDQQAASEKTDFEATVVVPPTGSEDSPNAGDDASQQSVFEKTATVSPPSEDSAADAGSPFNSTTVMPERESDDGSGENSDGDQVDATSGTVVMPRDEGGVPTDSAMMGTVVTDDGDVEKTQIFSQTMGMRGLSEEEIEEWEKERAEKARSDTDVIEPGDASESTMGRRTQIWSKQSADGLDQTLTIRARPVAGDQQFESPEAAADRPDYQIIEKLAEGGMGAIYVASQTSLGREVAIKTLKPLKESERRSYESSGRLSRINRQRREMFLSEALVTANLVHPHIIPIHDLCETADQTPFYVMKRVNGTPWNELIGEMSLEDNLEVLLKVCDAMAYAHHNGVVNRDLKPENIMLGEFGEVLVLDWGLAVPSREDDKKRFASPSASFGAGTPAYMSPELWTGPAEAIGTWSDIYLLGAILFEIITGKAPHKFPDPGSSEGNSGLWQIIDNVVRKNEIRETDVTGELMDIARKAMATDPADRHSSVLEFQKAIKQFQKHEESRHLSDRASQTLSGSGSQVQRGDRRAGETDGRPFAERQPERRKNVADRRQSYENYQTAVALYEEACNAWPGNRDARIGLRTARMAYARLALAKGDYDLGLQIAARETDDEFVQLSRQLRKARLLRNGLKYATAAAVLIIVVVGAISFKQKQEITALVGTRDRLQSEVALAEERKADAERKVAAAEEQVRIADQKVLDADRQVAAANLRIEEANDKLAEANAKVAMVETQLAAAEQKLKIADERLAAANLQVAEADKKLKLAETRLAEANQQLVAANRQVEKTQIEVKKLEEQKRQLIAEKERLDRERLRADVELRNASIASLIRNADYAAALQRVNELLTALTQDPQLSRLPEEEREQRITELKARQRQLLRRARATETPVQTQTVSPTGRFVVWGDSSGQLTVFQKDDQAPTLPERPLTTLKADAPISRIVLTDGDSHIVVAAGNAVLAWQTADLQAPPLKFTEHRANVTAIAARGTTVFTADQRGTIHAFQLTDGRPLWSIRSGVGIRDLELMPSAGILLYAGSRGGESADIMAYRLSEEDPSQRPERLGQLRLPRGRVYPPLRLCVSPDESLLLISNSRNGDVLVLPRRTDATGQTRDDFPFVHASELAEQDGAADWVVSRHYRPVNDIQFSADGLRVATASDDRSVGIWKVTSADGQKTLTLLHRLEGHGARVTAAGFLDRAGRFVISTAADRFCRLWDVQTYEEEKKAIERQFNLARDDALLQSQYMTVTQNAWKLTSHGRRSASVGAEQAQTEYQVLNADRSVQRGAIRSIDLTADGRRLFTGAEDGTAVLWDASSGTPLKSINASNGRQNAVPPGDGVGTGKDGDSAFAAFDEGHDFNVARLLFLPPDGRIVLTTGFDGNLCLWNADTDSGTAGYEQLQVSGLGLVNAVAASADGRLIAASSADSQSSSAGTVNVWQTRDLLKGGVRPFVTLAGFHRADVSACAIHPDGRLLATGGLDGRVAVWDVSTGERVAGGQVHAKNTIVSYLYWLASGELLSAGFDGRLQQHAVPVPAAGKSASEKVPALQTTVTYQHDRIPIERVSVSPDGTRFVTVSVRTDKATRHTQYELQLWKTGVVEAVRRIHPASVQGQPPRRISAANWSPDGSLLAVVVDGRLQMFSTETWKVQKVLAAPGLGISDAVFAPVQTEGHLTLATFDGKASHLWNLSDYSHITSFRPLYAVESLDAADDPRHSLLLTGDRDIRIFVADANQPSFGATLAKVSDPHRGIVTGLRFADTGAAGSAAVAPDRRFVSTGADGSAALWGYSAETHRVRRLRWLRQRGAPFVQLDAASGTGRMLLLDAEGNVLLLNPEANIQQNTVSLTLKPQQQTQFLAGAIHPDGHVFAVAGMDAVSGESIAWIYSMREDDSPALHCTIRGHEAGGIRGIAFLPDSPYVVTGGADGDVILWNWQPSRRGQHSLQAYEAYQFLLADRPRAHEAPVTDVCVSASGIIATASDDGLAVVWQNPFRQQ